MELTDFDLLEGWMAAVGWVYQYNPRRARKSRSLVYSEGATRYCSSLPSG